MTRLITKQEEQAYRLVSRLSIETAAKEMKLTIRRIQQLLRSVRQKAPQLFAEPSYVPRGRIVSYDPSMDENIVRKF